MAQSNERSSVWTRMGVYLGFVEPKEVRTAPQGALIPPARSDGTTLSIDTALGITAVYRSVFILVTQVSQMPLGVYRTMNGVTTEIETPSLIKNPNVNDTQQGFIEQTVFDLATHGEAFWRLYRSGPGEPVQNIEVLPPSTMGYTKRESDGKIIWSQGNHEFKPHQIHHLRLIKRSGEVRGLGPIQMAKGELQAALNLRKYSDEWFTSGVPQGYLTTDQPLNAEQAREYSQGWASYVAEGKIPVLGGGFKFEYLHLKPGDAQMLEVQKSVVTNIARLFGIPAMHLLADMGISNTYLNLEQASIVHLQTTLARYMNEIENALTDLLPRGQKVEFKEEALLRTDSPTKWDVIKTQVEVGYTSGNELRKAEGKQPIPIPAAEATPPEETPVGDED